MCLLIDLCRLLARSVRLFVPNPCCLSVSMPVIFICVFVFMHVYNYVSCACLSFYLPRSFFASSLDLSYALLFLSLSRLMWSVLAFLFFSGFSCLSDVRDAFLCRCDCYIVSNPSQISCTVACAASALSLGILDGEGTGQWSHTFICRG